MAKTNKRDKVGRPEKISKQQALKICRLIEKMPDDDIPVNWPNVIAHAKKKFRETYTRGMLSQKKWDSRKLIGEAFSLAKEVQKRMDNDAPIKYKTAPRKVLQKRIMELEATVLALREELERERAQQVDKLDVFLNTKCDLPRLLDQAVRWTPEGSAVFRQESRLSVHSQRNYASVGGESDTKQE